MKRVKLILLKNSNQLNKDNKMTLQEILLIAKPMDRIKRVDPDWLTKYLIICEKKTNLYLIHHSSVIGISAKPYIPILDDLISNDWDFMR